MKNPYWKEIYKNAPSDTLREHYRVEFDNSPFVLGDDYDEDKYTREIGQIKGKLGKIDVQYLYDNSMGAEKSFYKKWLAKFSEEGK